MLCSVCNNEATKQLRIEPRENPMLAKIVLACQNCVAGIEKRYGGRSDRQVIIQELGAQGKKGPDWIGMLPPE